MSGLHKSTSYAPVPIGTASVVNVRAIQVTYKKGRPNYPVSIKIRTGGHAEYRSLDYSVNDEIIWTFEKEFPSASQFTIAVREHRTFRKLHILDRTISASELAVNPTFTLDESKDMPVVITIWSISTGLLSELSRRLVEDAQRRLREMKTFVEGLARVCDGLDLIIGVTEPVSYAHPAARSAMSAAQALIEMCRKYQECHETASTLMRDIAGFFTFTEIPMEHLKCNSTEQTVKCLLTTFANIATLITEFSSDTVVGFLLNERLEEINAYKEELKMLKETFDWCVKTETWRTVVRIEMHTESQLLTRLPSCTAAFYKKEMSCFDGSRMDTLRMIEKWSTSDSKLLWLTGPNGYGKSTIAHTVAESLADQNRLAGCFFCDADEEELRIPERIIPTIAYQLAKWHKCYRSIILDVLHGPREPEVHESLQSQFDLLLKEPLKQLSDDKYSKYLPPTHSPLIIVLDAVDECRESEYSRHSFCDNIVDIATLVPWIKVIVTSQGSEDIKRCFQRIEFLHLDIGDPSLDLRHDISVYTKLCAKRTIGTVKAPLGLGNAVRGLFTRISRSLEELRAIENTGGLTSDKDPWDADALYCTLLKHATKKGGYDGEERLVVTDVLAVVYCLDHVKPPTEDVLLSFLHTVWPVTTSEKLHNLVPSLSPLVTRGPGNILQVLLPHVDILEFMSDRRRSGPFWVDIDAVKSRLARHCLDIMHANLKFNICNLESSYLKNTEVSDLEDRIKSCIPEPLQYCCSEWMELIMQLQPGATPNLSESVQGLLCSPKALFWLEVLSLIGALEEGKRILSRCMEHFKENFKICAMAEELYDFICTHQTAAELSTPHIYISASVWLAADSPLANLLSLPIADRPRFTSEGSAQLGPVKKSMVSDEYIWCIACSMDGNRIVSGHWSGHLNIWDGRTGELVIGLFEDHTGAISSVAFSPDGNRIAAGSQDGMLRVWDARSGFVVLRLQSLNESAVRAVAYSPSGSRIVSGHDDGRVVTWDAVSGNVLVTLAGCHESHASAVAYSPDEERIVSGSFDGALWIWDASSGAPIEKSDSGHEDRVEAVAYSRDGSMIVSGSRDITVRIWDGHTGNPIGGPFKGHEGWAGDVGFSRDGNRIRSSSWRAIYDWDAKDGRLLRVIRQNECYWDPEKQCFVSIPKWWPERKLLKIQSLIYSANPTTVSDSGWIRTLDGGLLLWVPPDHRDCTCHAKHGRTISMDEQDERILKSEWRKLPHGKDWTRIMAVEGTT